MKAQNQMKMQISSTILQNLDFLNNLTDRRLRVNITGFRYRFNQTWHRFILLSGSTWPSPSKICNTDSVSPSTFRWFRFFLVAPMRRHGRSSLAILLGDVHFLVDDATLTKKAPNHALDGWLRRALVEIYVDYRNERLLVGSEPGIKLDMRYRVTATSGGDPTRYNFLRVRVAGVALY